MIGNSIVKLMIHKELLWMWTLREIKIRYKQSILGVAWAILQPLALMVIFSVVFSFFINVPTNGIPYPIFSYVAVLPWTFFASSLTFGASSLVNNMNLITKIYFPREILPIAAILAAFFDFLIASVVFIAMLIFYHITITSTILWIPFLIFLQIIFTFSIVFFISTLNVFYRDIRFIVPLGLQIWMYACPVVYPSDLVPQPLLFFYMLNPMATIIDSYRRVLLQSQPPIYLFLLIVFIISLILIISGYIFFKRSEAKFADYI